MAEAGSRSGSSFPQFSGFGFKSLTRATSLLSIGSKNSEDKKQPTSSPAEPGTTGFDGPPAVSTPVNYGNDEVTVDEEGYRVVVHKDPFASSSAGRNFEDDDDDVEGSHQAHQPKFKVEIKEQAIVDGSEDLATAMSNMAEKMKTGSNMRRISIARYVQAPILNGSCSFPFYLLGNLHPPQ